MGDAFRLTWVRCALLGVIGFIVHLPAMQGTLIWDDEYLARENPFIKSPLLILETFRHYLFPEAFSTHYRPVQTVSYLFDYVFWNSNTYGFHLSNIIWHVAGGVLLYFLLRRLLAGLCNSAAAKSLNQKDRLLSALAFFLALLWVIHPVHSAAVDYISGRADSLAFFFGCAAWLSFLRARETKNSLGCTAFYVLSALSLLLALCSRESGLIWVALFLFYQLFLQRKPGLRAKLVILLTCLSVVGIYDGLRHLPRDTRPAPTPSETAAATRAVLMLRALGDYGRLMIFPANLHMERTVETDGNALLSANGWRRTVATEYLSIVGLGVAAALIFGACRKGPGRYVRIFGASWFVIAYLPISNLIELNATVAEHWLYLPSVGFLLFLGGCCLDFPQSSRRYLTAGACLFAFALSARSMVRSSDWLSPETFYRRSIGAGGTKLRLALNLAAIYTAKEDYVRAESLLRKVLEMSPEYPIARNSLAHVLFKEGKTEEATALFVAASQAAEEARKDYPKTWIAALNVAHMRCNENRTDEALTVLRQASRDYPDTWEVIRFQAEILRKTRGPAAALQSLEGFARANWWHAGAAIAVGKLSYEKGDLEEAEAALRHASRLDLHDTEALNVITLMKIQQNKLDDAYAVQTRAVARQPDEPRQYLMLADVLEHMGRGEEAARARARCDELQALAQVSVAKN